MIDRLQIQNLTTMSRLEIDISPKMNVIIGANGMGKTHLLKAAYGLSSVANDLQIQKTLAVEESRRHATEKITRLFRPMDNKLGRLHRWGQKEDTEISATWADGTSFAMRFSANATYANLSGDPKQTSVSIGSPIFIPTKEVLSFLNGVTNPGADRNTIDQIFDDSYQDILRKLAIPKDDEASQRINRDPRFGSLFPSIGNAAGGIFEIDKGGLRFLPGQYGDKRVADQPKLGVLHETVFKRTTKEDVSGSMTAEGFRKIGMLQHLLANRSLDPGTTGTLFWDEPECNMNPRLMRLLVEILLVLSRSNQQVVVATHDYVLLKWFDLLCDSSRGDHVRYHALYEEDGDEGVRVASTEDYRKICPNPIADTFDELSKEQIRKRVGELKQ